MSQSDAVQLADQLASYVAAGGGDLALVARAETFVRAHAIAERAASQQLARIWTMLNESDPTRVKRAKQAIVEFLGMQVLASAQPLQSSRSCA